MWLKRIASFASKVTSVLILKVSHHESGKGSNPLLDNIFFVQFEHCSWEADNRTIQRRLVFFLHWIVPHCSIPSVFSAGGYTDSTRPLARLTITGTSCLSDDVQRQTKFCMLYCELVYARLFKPPVCCTTWRPYWYQLSQERGSRILWNGFFWKSGVSIFGQERGKSARALFDGIYVAFPTGDYCRLYCDNTAKRQVALWPYWA